MVYKRPKQPQQVYFVVVIVVVGECYRRLLHKSDSFLVEQFKEWLISVLDASPRH
ncbi:hypothetical protein D3C84_332010 [compost metagenome]